MIISQNFVHYPAPGSHLVRFAGDIVTFQLKLDGVNSGTAFLRTNIGRAQIIRNEIIENIDAHKTPLAKAWYDIALTKKNDALFEIELGLCEVGHFQAKAFFLKQGTTTPIWPAGENVIINVEPADTCCSNTIYNAFVRQFGPNKKGQLTLPKNTNAQIKILDELAYTVIPPSGTFRDLQNELDFIINELGCRYIQLLPIHPTPTTYARMGRFGSPYAALSFTDVDPALAVFDPCATPMEQFIELLDVIHQKGGKLIIDIAINHTGWAAELHESHPQWLSRDDSGKIEMPGAWGITWEDLTKLDYSHPDLWQYMADIFLLWCKRGVDGFRCDAGYMIPTEAWQYIIARVRTHFPNSIFLLEGLGGAVEKTKELLNSANFNWAYSELFQNYDRHQISHYIPESNEISQTRGSTIHFAETHDNNRLAAQSETYARLRTALCGLVSINGGFAFTNGVEWLADEKINVHGASSLNWGAQTNLVSHIQRINTILHTHPCFHDNVTIKQIQVGDGNYVVFLRYHQKKGKKLIIAANLNDTDSVQARWLPHETGIANYDFIDLLSEKGVTPHILENQCALELAPGQVACLSPEKEALGIIQKSAFPLFHGHSRIQKQRLQAKVIEINQHYYGAGQMSGDQLKKAGVLLTANPMDYLKSVNPANRESNSVLWTWPDDCNRDVMVPPGHFIMVNSIYPMRAQLLNEETDEVIIQEESFVGRQPCHFIIFSPQACIQSFYRIKLKLKVFASAEIKQAEGHFLIIPGHNHVRPKTVFERAEVLKEPVLFLGTNGRGGMTRASSHWGLLNTKYDALLAANHDPEFPEDRWIMFTRLRAWVIFQGYSREISLDCLEKFQVEINSHCIWFFQIPSGQGQFVRLTVRLQMQPMENVILMEFSRGQGDNHSDMLPDDQEIQVILRPDIEDRNFHQTTKAYKGPEKNWPQAVQPFEHGFCFAPWENQLKIEVDQGLFFKEPEWQYMTFHPLDAERGLEPDSDLFSPGYFQITLTGHKDTNKAILKASCDRIVSKNGSLSQKGRDVIFNPDGLNGKISIQNLLQKAMAQFVVRRGQLKTVIAGYPWFLDWGRDSLIFVRGMIAAGWTLDVKKIIKKFAEFEENGTIPNMIHGEDASDRDTSDAPLWLFVTIKEYMDKLKTTSLLDEVCGKRSLRQILISMGHSLVSGAANGVKMDEESGLLFSPSHFTWMDTNFPAGTPREGYPIEIQAFWYLSLSLLAQIEPQNTKWACMAQKVRLSIKSMFWLNNEGYLADCLRVGQNGSAAQAIPDDALRPNQLFAITLGAIDDFAMCESILEQCNRLLVPGAIRSLSNRKVKLPLEIIRDDQLLNNPHYPYYGIYSGDEDTQRKPAYHNGTAWTWVFPSYCEAWVQIYGPQSKKTALAILSSAFTLFNKGCVGQIPEILDGDFPHRVKGCDAQAWGVSELFRVYQLLTQ